MKFHTERRTLVLFNHDFDRLAHERLAAAWPTVSAGFDLFAWPSQLRLAWFNLERFAALQAARARAQRIKAVVSHHEQFGALSAALVAERLGVPGTPVRAVLACQHKLHARRVLGEVCPQASVPFARLDPRSPELPFPFFVKPVKAAFSVLAREVRGPQELEAHLRFGRAESALLSLLSRPFERVVSRRLPEAGSSRGALIEAPVRARQYNLDGYVYEGEVRRLGVVDSIMHPGTQAFMRFDYPSRLKPSVVDRAFAIAERFLHAIGFNHGLFNMEFFHDDHTDTVSVIEFNPRLASQFSDLYERVDGVNPHEIAMALAHGADPALLPRAEPTAAVASSFVYRTFDSRRAHHQPTALQRGLLHAAYPDALFVEYPKSPVAAERDQKWLGSCRHGILNLGGRDASDLRRRCEVASRLLGWLPPYDEFHPVRGAPAPEPMLPANGTSTASMGSITP